MTINVTSCLLLFPAIVYDMQRSLLYLEEESMPPFDPFNYTEDATLLKTAGLEMTSNLSEYLLLQNNSGRH